MGRSQMIVRVARDGFLQKHRAEMVDFLEDYLHALHYLSDPAHRQEALEIIAEATKQKPSLYEELGLHNKGLLPRPQWAAGPARRCRPMSICSTSSASCAHRSEVKKYADLSLVKQGRRGPSSRGSSLKGGAGWIEL